MPENRDNNTRVPSPRGRREPSSTGKSKSVSRTSSDSTPAKTPVKKKAPAKKRNVVRMSNSGWMLYIIVIILTSCIFSYFAITMANDMFGFVKKDEVVTLTITETSTTEEIAKMLKENDVIEYKGLFEFYVKITKKDGKFNFGNYDLNKNMTYQQSIATLMNVSKDASTVKVTIPEGLEMRQIFALLEKEGVCSAERLAETAQTRQWKHTFLKDVPKDKANRLEGYLFPDTYEFYKGDSDVNVINKMLNTFGEKFSADYEKRAQEIGMTMDEVIILASVIEREAANDEERELISSVFHNRLKSGDYQKLQSCATVQYVLKERKAVLSGSDISIDSPYNTYKYKGLPVGPIASPGVASIEAALYPQESKYLFFCAARDGKGSLFAETYAQHEKNIDEAGIRQGV